MVDLVTYPTNRNDADETKYSAMTAAKFRNGIYKSLPGTNDLEVFADATGMQVKVRTGMLLMGGFDAESLTLATISLAAADATNPRIDRIVARLDRTDPATISIIPITGAPAFNPAVPALTNNSSTTDMPLAQVRIPSKASTIVANNVTDERVYTAPRGLGNGLPGTLGSATGSAGASPFAAALDHVHPLDQQALLRLLIPAGSIFPYAGAGSVPSGWLLCDGRIVSRSEYPQLSQVTSGLYGVGDGSTTFQVPDFRERFLSGPNLSPAGRGVVGSSNGSDTNVRKHSHSVDGGDFGFRMVVTESPSSLYLASSGPQPVSITNIESAGPDDYKASLPRYAVVNWIIKAH